MTKTTAWRMVLYILGAAVAAGSTWLGGSRARAAPGDLAPERTATGVVRSEEHYTDMYPWCAIRGAHPQPDGMRPAPFGVVSVGRSFDLAPYTPPLPCMDLYWRDFQGLIRFDLGELGRRGYAPELLRATLLFRRDWSNPGEAQIDDARCQDRGLLVEELEPGAGWVLSRSPHGSPSHDDTWAVPVRAGEPVARRRSGDESFSVDVTAPVNRWLNGAPNAGISLRLEPHGLPSLSGAANEPHGWVVRRCIHIYRDFALRVETAPPGLGQGATGVPGRDVILPPSGGSGTMPTQPGARAMTIRGVASYSPSVTLPAAGQVIEAYIGPTRCGRTDTPVGADGRFTLVVQPDSSAYPGCGVTGRPDREQISFRIGPIAARQPAIFVGGTELTLNLSP